MSRYTTQQAAGVWPYRLAWGLCMMTLPLIGVGGLITTTDAGMAVPDWPGTYGHNLFLYPWQTWVFGPWDLFIEHGHRLLASLIGLVTIALVVVCYRSKRGRRLRRLALIALALVILQGLLGGLRVVANERLLAMAHGVTGPLFFAWTCLIAARVTPVPRGSVRPSLAGVGWLALATAIVTFLQLMLGASLRHVPESTDPWTFATLTKLHLAGAAVVTLHALSLAWRASRKADLPRGVRVAGILVGVAVLLQVAAGFGAWVLKYGRPVWANSWAPATIEANVAVGWWQTYIVTSHQVGGSLLLGMGVFVATRALSARKVSNPESAAPSPTDPSVPSDTTAGNRGALA